MPRQAGSIISSAVMLLLLVAGFCPGCSNTRSDSDQSKPAQPPSIPPTQARPTVALVIKTLTNPYWTTVEEGARRAQGELGIELVVKTGAKETSVQQQIALVEQLIRERVSAIVIAPVSSTELIPVLAQAKQAGIPIINIDEPLNAAMARQYGLGEVPLIVADSEQGAYLAAQFLSRKITSPTKVAIVEGLRSSETAEARRRGALRAFGENSHIQVVAMESANWNIEEARAVAEQMFAAHPDIKALFCANDMMALGVLQYLEEAGKKDIMVTGYDALEEARAAIRQGKLLLTVDQQAAMRGYMGVEAAIRALRGETLPATTVVDVKLVTAEALR